MMSQYLPSKKAKEDSVWGRLKGYFELAVAIAFGVVLPLAFSSERFRFALDFHRQDLVPLPQLSVILLLFSIVLTLAWWRAVSGEMQMLKDFGQSFVPEVPKGTFYAAVGLPVLLALLAYFSNRPLIFSALYALLNLFGGWACWLRDNNIRDGLKRARSESDPSDIRRGAWDIIENFYFRRPQIPLSLTETGLSVVAIVLSVYGELQQQADTKIWLISAAYAVILLTIALNISIYTWWRIVRDKALGARYW